MVVYVVVYVMTFHFSLMYLECMIASEQFLWDLNPKDLPPVMVEVSVKVVTG